MKKSSKLDGLRLDVEFIDTVIVGLIAKREKTVLEIEKIKRKAGKPIFSKELEDRRIKLAVDHAKNLKMGIRFQKLTKKIITEIITHCRNSELHQKNAGRK